METMSTFSYHLHTSQVSCPILHPPLLFIHFLYLHHHPNSPSLTLVLPLFSLPIAPLSLSNSFIEPTSRHHLPLPLISLFCHPFQACMDISASHQPLHTHIRMYSLFIPPISTLPISPLCVKSLMRTSSHHLFPLYTTIIPTNAPSRISYSPHLSKLHAHSFPSPSSSYLSYHKLITINLSHAVHQAPTSAPSLHFRLYPWSWFVPSFPLVHLETMATIQRIHAPPRCPRPTISLRFNLPTLSPLEGSICSHCPKPISIIIT